jgi:Arc/MetJ-type ribon-helix-helix transcriptional regulator
LAQNTYVTIDLASDVEAFLHAQVRSGVCSDAADLVNDVLRSLRDQQRQPFQVTPELEAWLLKTADNPTTTLTREDFDGIRQRVLGRNKKT